MLTLSIGALALALVVVIVANAKRHNTRIPAYIPPTRCDRKHRHYTR